MVENNNNLLGKNKLSIVYENLFYLLTVRHKNYWYEFLNIPFYIGNHQILEILLIPK